MTKDQLRELLAEHIRQPSHKRNPGHSVVAIYLGREEWMSLVNERGIYSHIRLREGSDIDFDGVPVHRVNEPNHIRIVSEYVDHV
jgi:hypothetical protein